MGSIGELRGITPKEATKLRKAGVRTTESLLKQAGTKRGRGALGRSTGLDPDRIMEWVDRADLMRVKGIGAEYADLLKMAGVDSVKALRRRNAASLLRTMSELNDDTRLVRRLPTESMVGSWVRFAASLDPVIKS